MRETRSLKTNNRKADQRRSAASGLTRVVTATGRRRLKGRGFLPKMIGGIIPCLNLPLQPRGLKVELMGNPSILLPLSLPLPRLNAPPSTGTNVSITLNLASIHTVSFTRNWEFRPLNSKTGLMKKLKTSFKKLTGNEDKRCSKRYLSREPCLKRIAFASSAIRTFPALDRCLVCSSGPPIHRRLPPPLTTSDGCLDASPSSPARCGRFSSPCSPALRGFTSRPLLRCLSGPPPGLPPSHSPLLAAACRPPPSPPFFDDGFPFPLPFGPPLPPSLGFLVLGFSSFGLRPTVSVSHPSGFFVLCYLLINFLGEVFMVKASTWEPRGPRFHPLGSRPWPSLA
jgi:hypothetical protein